MNIGELVEKIKQQAANGKVLLLETENATVRNYDGEEFLTIGLVNNNDNLHRLFRYVNFNSVPLFIYEHRITKTDIESATFTEEDIKETELDSQDPKWIKDLEKKVLFHNEQVKMIECNSLLWASLYTVLPSQVIVQMSFHHEKYNEWIDLLSCTFEDLITDLEEETPEFYGKKEKLKKQQNEKQQQIRETIFQKWEDYLTSNPEFQFQTNQSLRRDFYRTHYKTFIESLLKIEQEEFDKLPIFNLHSQMEIVWKKFKQK